ncbi:GNAT family N-acetyltransferase [Actinomadura logoneensis]|uniref:GNAT family N-acetyltransferase n=1 Tax=Actinomadura logoneensis TaxID=2293572 RepID=A0A372JD90_9ACTN|nr:GNAT family N-acetyltransferase [Actinomadura logoneensis]RFU37348.1 GNAT family N-acetyltransferase [Actinomadura logoneensis]
MIRPARSEDVPTILGLIRDLAEYERAAHEVRATEDDLLRSLFGPEPKVFAHVAELDGRVVGFALWFLSYSTWLGRHGVYLEDLYVSPEARGKGFGRALLAELTRIADQRGYGRVEWSVLDWNAPAIGFYESLGARPQEDWTVYRLTEDTFPSLTRD